MIVSVTIGVQIGAWLNYQTGIMSTSDLSPPYTIMWPTYTMTLNMILRTILGFSLVVILKVLAKRIFYHLLCAILKQDVKQVKKSENTLQNTQKIFIELGCSYLTCASIGFFILYGIPHVFRYFKIERPQFYTEI